MSMNLVDHEVTGLRAAFDAVATCAVAEAWRSPTARSLASCPQSALAPGDVEYLRLAGFEPESQILERLVAATEGE